MSMSGDRILQFDRRAMLLSGSFGIFFGLSMEMGYLTDRYGSLADTGRGIIHLFAFLSISAVCTALLYMFLVCVVKPGIPSRIVPHGMIHIPLWKSCVAILIMWGPVYLGVYPGFYVYDTIEAFDSVRTGVFSTHHPLTHTLLLGGSVNLGGRFLHNYNYGIAIFIVIQMMIVAWVFAWVISTGGNGVLSVLWYGLFPTVVMFALCSVKDTMFATMLLAATVQIKQILSGDTGKAPSRGLYCMLSVSLMIMMLFRNNAVYAVAIYLIVLLITLMISGRKRYLTGVLLCILISLGLFAVINRTLIHITHADTGEYQETLTVPVQQMARAYRDHQHEMSAYDLDRLYELIPGAGLSVYDPHLSDPTKSYFDNEAFVADPVRYISLYFTLMRKYPVSYIDGWLGTSYGFFYPTVINVYRGCEMYTFTYSESSYFAYEVEYPGERHSFIPVIDKIYRWLSLDDDVQQIPVLSWLFSMGALFWIYALGVVVFVYQRRSPYVIAFILPLLIWITFLAGPTFLPRYAVYEWFALPYVCHAITEKTSSSA